MSYGERIPRSRAAPKIEALVSMLRHYGKVEVCGSFRRGLRDIGDVDIAVLPEAKNSLLAALDKWVIDGLIEQGKLANGSTSWGDKKRVLHYEGINFDIKIVDKNNFGFHVWLATGDGIKNARVMAMLKNNASTVRMKDGYCWHVSYDAAHPDYDAELGYAKLGKLRVPDEHTFYRLIGMPYIEPPNRSEQAARRYIGRRVNNPPPALLEALYVQQENQPLLQTSFL